MSDFSRHDIEVQIQFHHSRGTNYDKTKILSNVMIQVMTQDLQI